MSRVFATLSLAASLAGCAAVQSAPDAPPPDVRASVLQHKNQLWKDPESIRNATITKPWRGFGMTWKFCVRANAKNSFGGYTGEHDFLFGQIDDAHPPHLAAENAPMFCGDVPHEPFPELNGDHKPPQVTAKR